jgi:hypothetical protein
VAGQVISELAPEFDHRRRARNHLIVSTLAGKPIVVWRATEPCDEKQKGFEALKWRRLDATAGDRWAKAQGGQPVVPQVPARVT